MLGSNAILSNNQISKHIYLLFNIFSVWEDICQYFAYIHITTVNITILTELNQSIHVEKQHLSIYNISYNSFIQFNFLFALKKF